MKLQYSIAKGIENEIQNLGRKCGQIAKEIDDATFKLPFDAADLSKFSIKKPVFHDLSFKNLKNDEKEEEKEEKKVEDDNGSQIDNNLSISENKHKNEGNIVFDNDKSPRVQSKDIPHINKDASDDPPSHVITKEADKNEPPLAGQAPYKQDKAANPMQHHEDEKQKVVNQIEDVSDIDNKDDINNTKQNDKDDDKNNEDIEHKQIVEETVVQRENLGQNDKDNDNDDDHGDDKEKGHKNNEYAEREFEDAVENKQKNEKQTIATTNERKEEGKGDKVVKEVGYEDYIANKNENGKDDDDKNEDVQKQQVVEESLDQNDQGDCSDDKHDEDKEDGHKNSEHMGREGEDKIKNKHDANM